MNHLFWGNVLHIQQWYNKLSNLMHWITMAGCVVNRKHGIQGGICVS